MKVFCQLYLFAVLCTSVYSLAIKVRIANNISYEYIMCHLLLLRIGNIFTHHVAFTYRKRYRMKKMKLWWFIRVPKSKMIKCFKTEEVVPLHQMMLQLMYQYPRIIGSTTMVESKNLDTATKTQLALLNCLVRIPHLTMEPTVQMMLGLIIVLVAKLLGRSTSIQENANLSDTEDVMGL